MKNTIFGIVLLCCTFCIGCLQGRESLHEMDHEQPKHWPTSLRDATEKLRERESTCQSTNASTEAKQLARQELLDIIRWMPEIAADTDLPEKTWDEIYQQSETIRKALQSNKSIENVSSELNRLYGSLEKGEEMLAKLSSSQSQESQ